MIEPHEPLDVPGMPELPPRRPLPDHVRERLRARLREEMERPAGRQRRHRLRTPLTVAAAVVLLAGASVIVANTVHRGGDGGDDGGNTVGSAPLPPELTLDRAAAKLSLDRCATFADAATVDAFPPRDGWTPVYTVTKDAVTVVAARAGGKPLFCETTVTTVTVNIPSTTTAPSAVLIGPGGVVAGVVDPGWRRMLLGRPDTAGVPSAVELPVADGMFVAVTGAWPPAGGLTVTGLHERGGETTPLPVPPGGTVMSIHDRSPSPPPDRTSPQGRFLGTCLAEVTTPVVDPDLYRAGPQVFDGTETVEVATDGRSLASCRWRPQGRPAYDFASTPLRTDDRGVRLYTVLPAGNGVFIGGVGPSDASRIDMRVGDAAPVRTQLADGVLAAFLPGVHELSPTAKVTATVYDEQGRVSFDGPVPTP